MANLTKAQIQKKFDELQDDYAKLKNEYDNQPKTIVDTSAINALKQDVSNLTSELKTAQIEISRLTDANTAGMNAFQKIERENKSLKQELISASAPIEQPRPIRSILVNAH